MVISRHLSVQHTMPSLFLLLEPDEPSDISVEDVGPRMFTITWDVGGCEAGFTNYTVYVVDYGDGRLFQTNVSGMYFVSSLCSINLCQIWDHVSKLLLSGTLLKLSSIRGET